MVLPFPRFHYIILDSSLTSDTAAAEEESEEEYKTTVQMDIFTLARDCAGMG